MTNKDHNFTDNIICPYCGYEDNDSWEKSPDDGEIECGDCGEKFDYKRIVTVQYLTYKKEDNCEHQGGIYCDECGKKME